MSTSESMVVAAVGFAGVSMLWWGLAALVPIAIHLWRRRYQMQINWAAMRFLQEALRQRAQRSAVERLLLLLLRILVLILLSLAVARPYWSTLAQPSVQSSEDEPTLFVFVLDVSYSMNYQEPTGSLLQQAVLKAKRELDGLKPDDAVALIKLSMPSQAILPIATFDRSVILRELDRLRVTDHHADLMSALEQVQSVIEQNRQRYPQLTRARVYWWSDLAENTWSDAQTERGQELLKQISEQASLTLDSVGQDEQDKSNIAVTQLFVRDAILHAGDATAIGIEVQNTGSRDAQQVTIQLQMDGRSLASRVVDIKSANAVQLTVPWTATAPGQHLLQVKLPDDRLSNDNERRLRVDVRAATSILLVENVGGESDFIAAAIAPSESSDLHWQVARRRWAQLDTLQLDDYQCVILCAGIPGQAESAGKIDKLFQYVRRGGSLLAWLGAETNASSINGLIASSPTGLDSESSELFPFLLRQPSPWAAQSRPESYAIDPLEYRSPAVAAFRDFPDSGLLSLPIDRYWLVEPRDEASMAIDLGLGNGDPLIVHNDVGLGRAIWILTSLHPRGTRTADQGNDASWNAMAAWPSFVPLVHELIRFSRGTVREQGNVIVGGTVRGSFIGLQSPREWIVQLPSGEERHLVLGGQPGEVIDWSFSETTQQGVYLVSSPSTRGRATDDTSNEPDGASQARVPRGSSSSDDQFFVVNVDPRESDLRTLDVESLREFFKPAAQAKFNDASSEAEASIDLSRWVLVGLLLAMILECCVAWSFGRQMA